MNDRFDPGAADAQPAEQRIQRVGVAGAGVIGSGVAQLFAQTGHDVVLLDVDEARLQSARDSIRRNLKLYALLNKDRMAEGDAMERLYCSDDPRALSECEFVVENITEDWELKRALHETLSGFMPETACIAINTSAIPITRVAGLWRRPERVIGMHFMNPVPLMPMVEIIRAVKTDEATIDTARALVKQAGKESILVNDSPGFVTNRVMMLMVNEAMFLVHEGVATVQDVDRLFKTCFGHKMGPLETADLIGLDTVLRSLDVIYDELNDSKYRPCPLLKSKVYAGQCGRKSGQGFYAYDA